ncbi:MAG: hypothetical protein ACW99E_23560 [Promethearchaeota archaeon]|jgi:hypothetical protein
MPLYQEKDIIKMQGDFWKNSWTCVTRNGYSVVEGCMKIAYVDFISINTKAPCIAKIQHLGADYTMEELRFYSAT